MFVRFALLGEAVVGTSGKWNLLGTLNVIWGQEFPTVHPHIGMLLRIEGDHREIGPHILRVDFVNDLGERLSGPDPLSFTLGAPELPGFPIGFVIGVQIHNLQLPSTGNYDFAIRVDDVYLDSAPLYVRDKNDLVRLQKGS